MTKDVTITARIDEDLSQRLTRISASQGRSKSAIVGRALKSYLDEEIAFLEAVEAGLEDVRAGRVVSHEEVVAQFKAEFGESVGDGE